MKEKLLLSGKSQGFESNVEYKFTKNVCMLLCVFGSDIGAGRTDELNSSAEKTTTKVLLYIITVLHLL